MGDYELVLAVFHMVPRVPAAPNLFVHPPADLRKVHSSLQNLDFDHLKGTCRCLPEAAATPPSGRAHTAGGAVCARPLGGVAAASLAALLVCASSGEGQKSVAAGDDSTPLRSEIKL